MDRRKEHLLWIFCVSVIGMASANVLMGNNLELKYEVIQHNPPKIPTPTPCDTATRDAYSYYAKIKITNNNNVPLLPGAWKLAFCHKGIIESDRLDQTTLKYLPTQRNNMTLDKLKGCMYTLTPAEFFQIAPGETHAVILHVDNPIQSKYDVSTNYYLTDGQTSVVIPNTADPTRSFVEPVENAFQWSRAPMFIENYFPDAPVDMFELVEDDAKANVVNTDILPTPLQQTNGQGKVTLDRFTQILFDQRNPEIAALAQFTREKLSNTEVPRNKRALPASTINLNLRKPVGGLRKDGAYDLKVLPVINRVNIEADTAEGISNGIHSLFGLSKKSLQNIEIPATHINDKPRYKTRGLQLDVASQFLDKNDLKLLIDAMSMLKLNTLQLILANDVAFRLEIEGIPQLTQISGHHCHDELEKRCLLPQFGNDPQQHNTFYTKHDWIDILQHASKRQVKVIPQINFDAYSKAMEAGIREFSKTNQTFAYTDLSPPTRMYKYRKPNLLTEGKMDYCADEVILLFDELIRVVKSYYTSANTEIPAFAIGGDDVDIPTVLSNPRCAYRIASLTNQRRKMHPYIDTKLEFMKKLSDIAVKHNVKLNAYAEFFTAFPSACDAKEKCIGTYYHAFNLSKHFNDKFKVNLIHRDTFSEVRTVHADTVKWMLSRNMPTDSYQPTPDNMQTKVQQFQYNGYKTILSPGRYFNLQRKDGNRFEAYGDADYRSPNVELEDIYKYLPSEGVCCNSHRCIPNVLCSKEHYPEHEGLYARLDTSRLPGKIPVFKALFPRLIAFADKAWKRHNWESTIREATASGNQIDREKYLDLQQKDFIKFKTIVGEKILPEFDAMGVPYDMYMPGVKINSTGIYTSTQIPGNVVQVMTTTGNTNVWEDLPAHFVPQDINAFANRKYRATSKAGAMTSAVVTVDKDNQDRYRNDLEAKKNILNATKILEFPIQSEVLQDDPTGTINYMKPTSLPLHQNPENPQGRPFSHEEYVPYMEQLRELQRRQRILMQQAMLQQYHQRLQYIAALQASKQAAANQAGGTSAGTTGSSPQTPSGTSQRLPGSSQSGAPSTNLGASQNEVRNSQMPIGPTNRAGAGQSRVGALQNSAVPGGQNLGAPQSDARFGQIPTGPSQNQAGSLPNRQRTQNPAFPGQNLQTTRNQQGMSAPATSNSRFFSRRQDNQQNPQFARQNARPQNTLNSDTANPSNPANVNSMFRGQQFQPVNNPNLAMNQPVNNRRQRFDAHAATNRLNPR